MAPGCCSIAERSTAHRLRWPFGLAALCLAASSFADHLNGSYVHRGAQGSVTLTLEQRGSAVSGAMTGADGTVFRLQGEMQGPDVTGEVRSGTDRGLFLLRLVDGKLTIVVAETTGGRADFSRGWTLDFARAGAADPAPRAPAAQAPPAGARADAAGEVRDPSLVGRWLYSKTYQSGGFFGTTRARMQLSADGSLLYGDGDVTLGGDAEGRTGNSGDITRARWRTQGNVLQLREAGSAQWQPYARYHLEGGSLLLTYGDGSRKLWKRQ
jgi:hypothetical protein